MLGSDKAASKITWYISDSALKVRDTWDTVDETEKLTLVDLYVRPNIFSFTNHSSLASIQASLDRDGNLNGVRVGNTDIDDFASCNPING